MADRGGEMANGEAMTAGRKCGTLGRLRAKARRILSGGGLHELLYPINRSFLGHGVKAAVSLAHFGQKRRRRHVAAHLLRDPAAAAPARRLRQDGWASLDDTVDPALVAELTMVSRALADEHRRLESAQSQKHKTFWIRLLDEQKRDGLLDERHIAVRFALQPAVLDIATRYFGEVPYLSDVLLSLSVHTDDTLSISQLWHRDHDDVRVLKLFAYLSDVPDESYGPFTFLPRQPSRRVPGGMSSHKSDAEVFAAVGCESVRSMTGASGATFMVATSDCLHMGSRVAPGRTRLLYTACFIGAPPIYPGFHNRIRLAEGTSETARLVLRHRADGRA